MRIKGPIHMIEIDNNIIGIKNYKAISFFYFPNGLMNMYKKYLYQFNWIDLEYIHDKKVKKGPYLAYKVDFVYQIYGPGVFDKVIYFDKKSIDINTYKMLDKLNNTLFLDLEMSMPSYHYKGKEYPSEIIQAGYEVYDKNGELLNSYSNYIYPSLNIDVSERTLKFLNITKELLFNKGIPYHQFYREFKEDFTKYSPAIIIYGKNDKLILDKSFTINKVDPLQIRYINLLNIIKTFYNLKNDPGLFKLYEIYYEGHNEVQIHDALDDCHVTRLVFEAFKRDILDYKFYEKIRAKFNI